MLRKPVLLAAWSGLFTLAAEAQVSRVFVSVTGNDANVCSNVMTPCRTFAGGIGQVDPQGEVIVIDSGSYAGGTITKSVKINVAAGVVAFSGQPIVVDPGASGSVVLRGLTVKAAVVGSGVGITQVSGALHVENVVVDGWLHGLVSQSGAERLYMSGSYFRNQAQIALWVQIGSTARVAIDDSYFERNLAGGIEFFGGTGHVSNTVITGSVFGGVTSELGTEYTFERCKVSGNGTGLSAQNSSVLRAAYSTVTQNYSKGLNNYLDTATIESFGNNVIRGNLLGNTEGVITVVALQ